MKTEISLSLVLLFLTISCADWTPARKVGTCLKSQKHGGPYRMVSHRGYDIVVKKLDSSGDEVTLPNDKTWNEVSCP